jgi:hypothetical protein
MTSHNRCRIGLIKFKAGGEMRVLDTPRQGDPDVIDMLVNLLDRARRGDLVAFAMVSVRDDGTVGTGWTMGSNTDHFHELASGALTLAHRMGES